MTSCALLSSTMAAPVAAANDASPRPLKRPRLSLDKPDGSLDTGADFLSFDFSPEPEEPTRGKRSTETRLPAVRDGNRPAKNRGRAAGTDGANKRKAIDLDLEDEQEARQGSHPWAHYVRWQDHKDATEMCVCLFVRQLESSDWWTGSTQRSAPFTIT